MRSKRLTRQLKKAFSDPEFEASLIKAIQEWEGTQNSSHLESQIESLKSFQDFLDSIDRAYEQNEDRINISNRNLQLSSEELTELNETVTAIMNSLGQGLFVFGPDGRCLPIFSKSCLDLLVENPIGHHFWEVVGTPKEEIDDVKEWIEVLFQELIAFQDCAGFGPKKVNFSSVGAKGMHVSLNYKPLFSMSQKLKAVVVMATDRSEEFKAKKIAKEKMRHADRLMKIIENKNQYTRFLNLMKSFTNDLCEFVDSETPLNEAEANHFRVTIHSLKGVAASFFLEDLVAAFHESEMLIKSDGSTLSNLKLILEKIDRAMKTYENLNRLFLQPNLESVSSFRELPTLKLYEFADLLKNKTGDQGLEELFYKEIISEDVEEYLRGFEEALVIAAEGYEKKLNPILFECNGVKLVIEPYEEILNSVNHLLRNSISHGIEPSSQRADKGKEPKSNLKVTVESVTEPSKPRDTLVISVEDDGAGIDFEKIKELAVEKSILSEEDSVNNNNLIDILANPKFSTTKVADKLSGRGVGMTAVKEAVDKFNGTISVETIKDVGTKFIIKVPLIWNRDLIPSDVQKLKQAA